MAFGGLTAYLANCASCRIRYDDDLSCNVRPITWHEGTDEWQRYCSALSLTTELDGGGLVNATPPVAWPPGKEL